MDSFCTISTQGYWLKPSDAQGLHSFCGAHNTGGAMCPNCQKPLLRLLELDRSDSRLGICSRASCRLPLFFCWRCNVAQQKFYYRVGDGFIVLMEWGKNGVNDDFPYSDYPLFFARTPVDLVPLLEAEQQILKRLNCGIDAPRDFAYLEEPRHQLGGQPYLIQQNVDTVMECLECGEKMPFLCCVGDDAFGKGKFTGNPFVQTIFHYCPRCEVVGAYQQCD